MLIAAGALTYGVPSGCTVTIGTVMNAESLPDIPEAAPPGFLPWGKATGFFSVFASLFAAPLVSGWSPIAGIAGIVGTLIVTALGLAVHGFRERRRRAREIARQEVERHGQEHVAAAKLIFEQGQQIRQLQEDLDELRADHVALKADAKTKSAEAATERVAALLRQPQPGSYGQVVAARQQAIDDVTVQRIGAPARRPVAIRKVGASHRQP
jgi:uncharacterized membrane protein